MKIPPRGSRATLLIIALAAPFAGQAQEVEQTELDKLDEALVEFSDIAAPHNPADIKRIEEMQAEIDSLLLAIQQINLQMQGLRDGELAELRVENELLRQALRLRYGAGSGGLPPVPMPHRDLIESVVGDSSRSTLPSLRTPSASLDTSHAIVKEWGRTPEVVATMRGKASSLKGMAIVIPTTMPAEALIQLGKQLRVEFDSYDNLNIEIYDDRNAAEKFANTGSTDSIHRAMSISKHKNSGRDVILMMRDGAVTQIR